MIGDDSCNTGGSGHRHMATLTAMQAASVSATSTFDSDILSHSGDGPSVVVPRVAYAPPLDD